jgi:pimeloyl-ACP methyl ester carboxylesterase
MSGRSKEPGQTITLPDGRQLGYLIVGEGKPVFWFHGMPSSRVQALCLEGTARTWRLQIIGVDRPGFGLSTYVPKRRFRDIAADISLLADHLHINQFALAGVSGGGPHVAACAALLRERTTKAVVLCGLSLPLDTSGMHQTGRLMFGLTTVPIIGAWVQKIFRDTYLKRARDPNSEAGRRLAKDLPDDDARFYLSPSQSRDLLLRANIEAYHQGPDTTKAFIQEVKLWKKGWDVDLAQIPPGLVHIWHGTSDTSAPIRNAYKNAETIPGSHLKVFENEGHLFFMNHLEELGELLSS